MWIERTLTTIGEVIVARNGDQANVRQLAMEMISLVYGISIQRTLDPESWTPGQIASLIARKVREMDLSS
jgi:hypothetical protein